MKGWIGVDLDGTLAFYDHWRGADHVGEPIAPMLDRVKAWLAEGKDVRIFTARVNAEASGEQIKVREAIYEWCRQHIGQTIPVTCQKDYGMIELWDDRCVQVIPNTGRTLSDEIEAERQALRGKAATPP